MESTNLYEIIFLAIIAGVIIYRLNGILGTRIDTEVKPSATSDAPKQEDTATVIENTDVIQKSIVEASPEAKEIEKVIAENSELIEKLTAFKINVPDFETVTFLHGARAAFEIITNAFAKGDLDAMQDLVSENVFKSYKNIIDERKTSEQSFEFEIIRFVDAAIKDASVDVNHVAKIQVNFTTEQVNVLKDKEGKVISGSDSFINKVSDLWTFTKDINSSNPNWILVAAKSG